MVDASMIECVWSGRARLGEGPVWCPDRGDAGQLLFVDILGSRLHVHDLASRNTHGWKMDEACCWLVPRSDGDGFIAGLRSRLVHLRLDDAGPHLVSEWTTPLGEPAGNRFNDAKVDAQGRLWFGSMDDAAKHSSGSLYCLVERNIACQDTGYRVANGPAITPDGRTLYHSDTPRGVIYAFDLSASGKLTGKREHIRFSATQGYPDGMTCDSEGGLWVAHWDGGRLSRFRVDGVLDETLPLPASRVTSCAFGGVDLDQLFITTAAFERDGEPSAGGLFRVVAGFRGLPPERFAISGDSA
ncbi:SMP-30/gluconolactonase/LRE family protein [Halomonas sp. TRM85114]|uniref:SMP-30/gluconolactonase/LRE family protein n=1 Tax=Halomonas jincaotanensis TaxID=2810616 RepID=UPI001BD4D6B5|nr:SMP-30/gluconolactonase/LRE family protein [Halomonas jincaotanensis]MBS9402377.1 SMP-30/gluconolactonase/LRE family protein [Halomonas jincaotanensis]